MDNKKILLIVILIITLVFSTGMGGKYSKYDYAPDFTLTDINGESITLSSFKDKKIVVLNFFATWCHSCREELPQVQKFYDEYWTRDVEVLVINLQERKDVVSRYAKDNHLTFKFLLDKTGDVGMKYQVRYIPSNFIIDKNGKIVYKGLFTSYKKLKEEVNKVLLK